jgi:hypothetical protein
VKLDIIQEGDGSTKNVIARKASAEVKDRLWPQLVQEAPFFEDYQKKTKRELPMVILEPTDSAREKGCPGGHV